jgi:hypothetical protein
LPFDADDLLADEPSVAVVKDVHVRPGKDTVDESAFLLDALDEIEGGIARFLAAAVFFMYVFPRNISNAYSG